MAGLIPAGGLRLPLVEVDSEQRAAVRAALDAVGVPVAS
jgi:dihydrodipicolinate synthase/N-acetylneuraminate lyase